MLASPVAMHIPDGFLSVLVAAVLWLISIGSIGYALKRVSGSLGERQVPVMGVLAAAIFAGQMVNFTVAGGTSGHLLGAALATIVLGPWAAVPVMTSVVGIQALIFQDGGLLALGANIFNMVIVGVTVSYFSYRTSLRLLQKLANGRSWPTLVSGFAAGWSSIFIASLACALQLALSGTSPANVAVPTMAGIHALIGIGEGLITAGALAFILAARRDLLEPAVISEKGNDRAVWIGGLVIAVALAILSPLASTHPDGLEWAAAQRGFLSLAQEPFFDIIPDYILPGVRNEALATILAGVIGVGLVLAATLAVARMRRRK